MKHISSYFGKGLIVLLPLLLAVALIRQLLTLIVPAGTGFLGALLALSAAAILVTIIGYFASKGFRLFFRYRAFKLIGTFPFIRQIINSAKKFLLILNFSKEVFDKPVIVKREEGRELKVGFITREDLREFGLNDHCSVYLPDPFSFLGELVIVDRKDLEPIEGDKAAISNLILSGGVGKK